MCARKNWAFKWYETREILIIPSVLESKSQTFLALTQACLGAIKGATCRLQRDTGHVNTAALRLLHIVLNIQIAKAGFLIAIVFFLSHLRTSMLARQTLKFLALLVLATSFTVNAQTCRVAASAQHQYCGKA